MFKKDSDWAGAFARHAAAVEAYRATAHLIGDPQWTTPIAEGKWTPAEITEHLNRTYLVMIGQMRGESTGIRVRTNWAVRTALRQTALRWIFSKRALPRGAKAPSEVRPDRVEETRKQALERMARLGVEFEREASSHSSDNSKYLTHHIFGAIELLKAIDFVSIHIEHHHRQIETVS